MASAVDVVALLLALGSVDSADVSLAWDGIVSADTFTEVSVRATGAAGISTRIEVASASPRVRAVVDVDQEGQWAVALPVPADQGPIVVDDGQSSSIGSVSPRRAPPPVVVVGERAAVRLDDALTIEPGKLPHTASAYRHIAAIVISGPALAGLDENQLRALLEHVGTCGTTVLVDVSADVERLVTQRAGCGARRLAVASNGSDVESLLANLLSVSAPSMPGEQALEQLLSPEQADVRLMGVFVAAFLLVYFVLIAQKKTRNVAAPAFCVLATGIAALLWNGGSSGQFVAWAEVYDGDRVARYEGLDAISARGRSQYELAPESLARSPKRISGNAMTLVWDDLGSQRVIEWEPSLLQQFRLVSAGSFPVEPTLRAGMDAAGPVVCNVGAAASPAAFLYWQGQTYSVPPIEPNDRWSAHDDDVIHRRAAPLTLLGRRAGRTLLALLQPLSLPVQADVDQQAWLVRHESTNEAVSPCRG